MNSFDKLPVAITLVDAHLRYQFANRAYADLFGYKPADLVGNDPRQDVYAPHTAIYDEEMQRLVQGVPHSFEISVRVRSGQVQGLMVQTLPLLDENQEFSGALGVVHRAPAAGRSGDPNHDLRLANLAVLYTRALQERLARVPGLRVAEDENGGEPAEARPRGSLRERLTARQGEVLAFLVQGVPIEEIAARLTVSPHTVRNHLRAIYQRLGVHSQVELISKFWRSRG